VLKVGYKNSEKHKDKVVFHRILRWLERENQLESNHSSYQTVETQAGIEEKDNNLPEVAAMEAIKKSFIMLVQID